MTKIALILVAAGRGERAGGDIPKQYRDLAGKPLLSHTLDNAAKTGFFDQIVIVLAANDPLADSVLKDRTVTRAVGGATRTESVRAGLDALRDIPPELVMIHDAARPFVDSQIVSDLIEALKSHDGAVPALPITDAIKTTDFEPVDRDRLRRVQTPQAFHYSKIVDAFDTFSDDASAHDDIEVAEKAGLILAFTSGSKQNFKVTFAEDFAKAEAMLQSDQLSITGTGFDVHRLEDSDEPLWMCGIAIDCGMTLVGHSDADVGLHAITDAILGAVAQGDIGDHFPPTDPRWKGAASDQFLIHAIDLARKAEATLRHIDLTIICEKPKIKPHREAMRERISEITGLPLTRISVKATTTEALGFTGRGEGIATQAAVTLTVPA